MTTVRNLRPGTAILLRQLFQDSGAAWPNGLPEDVFFQEVAAQSMAPLLFRRITERGCHGWPEELLARFKETALRQAAAELRLEADIHALLKAFAAEGIQPLLLKGTALAYSLYPEPWLRPRCDTDLLIVASEREKAAAILRQLGCKPLLETTDMEHIGFGSEMHYAKIVQGIRINYDLHWKISHINRQFSAAFAEDRFQTTPIPVLGENARTLSRVDSLLYACFHRAGHFSHSGDRLIWLHDIHLLCQALTGSEAAAFCDKAKLLEISTLCADAVAVAQSWFGTVLPGPIERLRQEERSDEAFAALLKPGGRQVGIKNHALLELKGLPTWRARIRFLWQNAFPPPEFMLWRYGTAKKSALPLLYLKRFAEAVFIFLKK
ncbi:MAG: nucleotidyltransferase domain-containing protein [Candidatus Electronema sp. V4]|uniref:nucleotidyltransferase domain-containing protein n=1 Tax=Candidatus Electronema sp. V4 TaxID=3454756 RepID=UPI004055634B